MRVYRIEHNNNIGPYNQTCDVQTDHDVIDLANDLLSAHSADEEEHPCPGNDGISACMLFSLCGFESIEMLAEWFAGWIFELRTCGFSIAIYEVPEHRVAFGNRQVVFPITSARRICKKRLTFKHEKAFEQYYTVNTHVDDGSTQKHR